jgi:hypothetical protein
LRNNYLRKRYYHCCRYIYNACTYLRKLHINFMYLFILKCTVLYVPCIN